MARIYIKNRAGLQYGEWLVLDQHRPSQYKNGVSIEGKQFYMTEWLCRCSCGVEKWKNVAFLNRIKKNDSSSHCDSKKHLKCTKTFSSDPNSNWNYIIDGATSYKDLLEFTYILCKCGRTRKYQKQTLINNKIQTISCGCNGVDQITVIGDPNLPENVNSYNALINWAGCSRQAHYRMIQKRGSEYALEHLTKLAEKNHPGEGWRIKAIIPITSNNK